MSAMKVPSGRIFNTLDLSIIEASAQVGFIRWHDEPQGLASGKKSHIYVHGRQETTENEEFLRMCCRKILQDTKMIMDKDDDYRRPRFIGIPHVAHGWTPAITIVDAYEAITGRRACHAIMRSELKKHGANKSQWVAGTNDSSRFRDILFDNVVTDSGSKETAGKHLLEDGLLISEVDAMVFVDRQQGGLYCMELLGFRKVHACYLLLDMTFAFQQLGKWPSDAVKRVTDEIIENRIGF